MSSNTNIGNTPVNQGYVQLIHTGETGGIDGTLRTLYDGDGTAADLLIASDKVKVSTELFIGAKTLTEFIQDTVGTMFTTGNSLTNVSVTYDDANNNIDLNATGEVTLTGSQTLTNKTLTSPVINTSVSGTAILDEDNMSSNSDSKLATQQSIKAYVDAEVSSLVSSAPTALDTLDELAAALGDDANFATTTATSLGEKLVKASNLSDLTNTTTARSNLGLGSLATANNISVSNFNDAALQTSSESFADNDTSLMTSAAIQDKIESFGYTTNTGDMTGVSITASNPLDISQSNTTSGSYSATISLVASEFGGYLADMTESVVSNTDELAVLDNGTLKRKQFDEIGLSSFNNDSGFTTNTGDITGITTATTSGLTGGTTSGTASLVVDYLPATDDRDVKPNAITTSGRKQVRAYFSSLGGLTGTADSDYQDLLVLDTWSDGTGGDLNALAFDKSEQKIRHYLADQSASTFGTAKVLAYTDDLPITALNNATENELVTVGSTTTELDAESTLTWNGSDYLNIQSADGAEGGIRLKKSSTDATHTQYSISHRDDNQTLIIYSYDGTTFRNWITLDEPNALLKLGSNSSALSSFNSSGDLDMHGDIEISATNKLYLDGGSHTYIHEQADDILEFVVGNDILMKLTEAGSGIEFPQDSHPLKIGAGSDLQLNHNGSNSFVENYTGNLNIINNTDDGDIIFKSDNGSGGTTAYITLDGSVVRTEFNKNIKLSDNIQAHFGASNDLKIYHDGSNSYIQAEGTGDLILQNDNTDKDIILKSDDGSGGLATYLTLDGSATTIEIGQKMQFPASHTADKIVMYSGGNEKIGTEANTLLFTGANHVFHDTSNNDMMKITASGVFVDDISGLSNGTNKLVLDDDTNSATANGVSLTGVNHIYICPDETNNGVGEVRVIKGTDNDLDSGTATELFRITNAGKVGITEDSIDANLHITGSPVVVKLERAGQRAMRFGTPDNSAKFIFADSDDLKSNIAIEIDSSRDVKITESVGIGVAANGTAGRLDCSNDVVAFASSDKRLKENIKPLDNALDKINKINGVEFDWKKLTEKEKETIHGNTGHDVGVIAQEIEEVLPEVVQTRDNGYKAVKYEKIVPLLIEAIKELKQEIEDLK